MPKIEELKDRIIKDSERGLVNDYERDIILAAIEDAQRYKKDENGQWWKNYSSDGERWLQINENEIPAAVRAVLEVTGGGE